MTPSEAITRFNLTAADLNWGYATDFICSECGCRGPFNLNMNGVVTLESNGEFSGYTVSNDSDPSYCVCDICGRGDVVENFKVPGLDAELRKKTGL